MSGWPLPDVSDPLAARHFAAAAAGRLEMQRCAACGHVRWPVARACPQCLTDGGAWTVLGGRGTLWSYAVYHRPLHPAFEGHTPYAVGLVVLAEGAALHARLEATPAALAIGQPLRALFETLAPDIGVVRFRPAEGG